MSESILYMNHVDFGEETFRIVNPRYNLYQSEDGIWEFVICLQTDKAIKRAKELEEVIDPLPNFEATVVMPKGNLQLDPGRKLLQLEGYDYERDEHLSNFYYFNHNSVEVLEVEIHEVIDKDLRLTVKGKAIVNTTEPDADLLIESVVFMHDEAMERDIS